MTPRLSLKSTSTHMSTRDFRLIRCRSRCGRYSFSPLPPRFSISFFHSRFFGEHTSGITRKKAACMVQRGKLVLRIIKIPSRTYGNDDKLNIY